MASHPHGAAATGAPPVGCAPHPRGSGAARPLPTMVALKGWRRGRKEATGGDTAPLRHSSRAGWQAVDGPGAARASDGRAAARGRDGWLWGAHDQRG